MIPQLLRGLVPLYLALALLSGCASDAALKEGQRLIAEGKTREGLARLEQGMREHPGDLQYRAAYLRQRELLLAGALTEADAALRAERLDAAQAGYREVLGLHPENNRAAAGLAAVETVRRNQVLLREAQEAMRKDDLDAARGKLRAILAQDPAHAQAQALLAQAEEKAGRSRGFEAPQLGNAFRRPVSLEFRDAALRTVFDALARQSGLNFVFDRDVRLDQRTTLFVKGATIADALDMLLATSQLARKVLNNNTLLIYPNVPAKQRDYQDMVVRAFYLANTDAKQAMAMIRTMARIRDVYVDEKLNMVMVRDTPEAVRVAERLVRLADQAYGFALGKPGPDGAWRFPPREWKLYEKDIKAARRSLMATLPEEVDPRAFVALVLWWVENHREDIPPSPPERRHVWFTIAEQLQRLSELLDPEREDAPVEAGICLGIALQQASGVWR